MGIIEHLTVSGPLTATQLADRLDESPANCSWHLRKLAEHGFVEEAGGGTGRQRPWRVPGIGFTWDDPDASPEQRRAAEALSQVSCHAPSTGSTRRVGASPRNRGSGRTPHAERVRHLADGRGAPGDERRHRRDPAPPPRAAARPALRPPGSRLCEFVAWGVPMYIAGVEPTPEEADR